MAAAAKPKPKFSYSISPDSGSDSHDNYTSGTATHQLVLSGTGAKNDQITVSYADPVTHTITKLTTTVQADGNWSISTGSLAEGSYNFSITEKGTLKTSITSPPWVVDTHTNVTIANTASLTDQNTLPLTGTAELGDAIKVTYIDPVTHQTVTVGTTTTDSSGHWSLPTGVLSDNHYTFTATATDRAGNTATSTYSTTVDTTPPGVTNITSASADQNYHTGDGIDITLAFDETLHVTGTPTLSLNSGGTATYTGGDGTNTLTFHYTVAAGETTTDLNVAGLVLGSGVSIQDSAGNDVSLTLPASHTTGALDTNKDIVISSPTITYLTGTDTASDGIATLGEPSISADGHYVTFYSNASNLTGTADANGNIN